ncbi:MAG: ATP-binding protein, partial [Kangiellaceae bacterium]|nr:ATP-binding protein [Kangiellaceae bacterium]
GEYESLSNDEFLSQLLNAQISNNTERKIKRLATLSKLKYPNTYISDIDYTLYPSLKVNQVNQLAECNWVDDKKKYNRTP